MSKLLKSKFLLGVMTFAVMFVGAVASNATPASAETCSITTTLRVGSKGAEVKCLQAALDQGLVGDGSFGPKTKARVVAWQASVGLVADGVFGPKSRAAWMASMSVTYPAGCTSAVGYSSTTGVSCATGTTTTTTYPAGCTSAVGYSSTTGVSCAGGTTTTTTTTQTGPVSVSLASDNPASGYIIGNQAIADLLHVTFTGTGTVNSIVLNRGGISDQNTLSAVYLYDGATRLTDGYSFNNSGVLTINSIGLAVNGSKTISIKADVASGQTASSLTMSLTGFTAAGNAATTVSIKGNEMTYGTGNLASVYLDAANQTVGVASGTACTTACPTVNAGTSAYAVWSNPIQVNTRAVWLKGANFRMVGSAPADALGNIKLYVDGVAVGGAATMGTITGSNCAMFDFSAMPVSLSTGTHTVDLRADVVKGSSYTVSVSVQQASDLVIYDGQVAVNVAVTKNSTTAYTASASGTITINAGSASVTIDPTFQSYTNITGGATNTVIGKFKVHGYGEDVKVSTLVVKPLITSGTVSSGSNITTLNNITVYFNGSQVGSSQNYSGTALSYSLGSQMIIPAGTDSYIEIRGDLQNSDSINYTGGTLSAALNGLTNNAQGQTSHTNISFPAATGTNSSVTTLTIQTGTLAVSKNTGYASQSIAPNMDNVKIGSYVLQNQSSSESVRVTSLALALTRADGSTALTSSASAGVYPALTNFSNLRTSETSGSGGNSIQPAATNTISVDFTLAPGATKTIDILASTGSTAASAQFSTNLIVTSLGSSSNVSISQNGNANAVAGQVLTLAVGVITNNVPTTPSLTAASSTSQQFVPATSGATDATKATFKVLATGGAATISEMKFTVNSQDFSSVGTYSAVTVGSDVFTPTTAADAARFVAGDVVQVVAATTNGLGTVTAVGGTTVTVNVTVAATGTGSALRLVPATVTNVRIGSISAAPVAGVAYLTGLNLAVPNGGSGLSQEVFISYAPVGTNGVSTGSTSRVALESIKYSSGNTTTTICTATIAACGSGNVITAGGISAPTMKVVGSSPSISLMTPSTILTAGNMEIADVKVTATKGPITLNALPISVTLTNATLTSVSAASELYVQDANGNPVTTTFSTFSGSTSAPGTSTITFTSGYQIDTTQTFKIFLSIATVTNANGAHTSAASLGLGTADLLSWTDTAGNASSSTRLDATTGNGETSVSNRYLYTTTTPGFFYNYPTTTVSVSS